MRQNCTGTYVQNRPRTEKTGKLSYPLPLEKKKIESTPRELQCSDRAKPRPQVPNGLPVSTYLACWLNVLVRRDMIQNRRKFHKCTYTYIPL